jgi:hypothetical protein
MRSFDADEAADFAVCEGLARAGRVGAELEDV